jgi:hypothetical protein
VTELDKLRNGNDLAARLLRAGSDEQPRHAARSRAERALGLSGAAAAALLASKASASVAAAGVGWGARLAIPTFARWLALGMLTGGAAVGGVSAVRNAIEANAASAQRSRVPLVATAAHAGQAHAARPPIDSAPTATPAADKPHASGGASSSAEPPRALSGTSARLTSQPPAADAELPLASGDALLSHEVELLERVRAKLRAGNSGGALAELDAVAGDIRSLMMEADLLRVEALLAHGERARAEALADELRHRGGGQSFRLKRLLGGP